MEFMLYEKEDIFVIVLENIDFNNFRGDKVGE